MLNKRELKEIKERFESQKVIEDSQVDALEAAQTALVLTDMLAEITDTLDTVTDIIDESGEWGNINAQTTIETLDKAKALLKEMEG